MDYLIALDARDRAAVARVIALLEEHGTALGAPAAKHLQGRLWELRARGRVAHRVLYFAITGRRLVLLHAFAKKTQTTPRREMETALRRLNDYEARRTS
jgi:phage-related protein